MCLAPSAAAAGDDVSSCWAAVAAAVGLCAEAKAWFRLPEAPEVAIGCADAPREGSGTKGSCS